MELFPSSAAEKLGFGVLRDRALDVVLSPYGRERLIQHVPMSDVRLIRRELRSVAEVQAALQFDDPIPWRALDDVRPILSAAAPEGGYVTGPDLVSIQQVLTTVRLVGGYWRGRSERYPINARRSPSPSGYQALEREIGRVLDERGDVRDDASTELRRIRRTVQRAQAQLRDTLMRELRAAVAQGHATEEQPTIRGGRMVIPIRAEAKRKVSGFVHDASATGQTVYVEPTACLDLNNEVRELEAAERQEVLHILRSITALVRTQLNEIRCDIEYLGWFDFTYARAHLAILMSATVPEISEEAELSLREARNPALVLHFQRVAADTSDQTAREVVPLDVRLGDDLRTVVITGPNAGGKTVAMKTVGLISLMIAHGMPIPAHPNSRVCLFERVFVDIGDEQSIEEDLSTFSSHVANLSRILELADARSLVLIDEAGTGTDPQEGAALARAVLEHLTESGARTIVTTHHGALKAYAHDTPLVQNASMTFDEDTLKPTYAFRSGVPGSSYAFPIAQRQGLGKSVLRRASELLGTQQASFEALISTFQARTTEMERKIEALEEVRALAEGERSRFTAQLAALQAERDAVQAEALREAEAILAEANARVERTIREIREAQADREVTKDARERLASFSERIQKERERADRRDRRRRTSDQRVSARRQTGEIRLGDFVVIDEGSMAGEVMEIQGQTATLSVGAARLRVELSRLRKVPASAAAARQRRRASSGTPAPEPAEMRALQARSSLDVRGQRAVEAVEAVTRLVDDAVAANLDQVEILHGTGTGALRAAIREALGHHPSVGRLQDAPWDRGGPGVTLVSLR